MKAIVYTEYGSPDVLQLKEVATPTPKDNEVLVRVLATPVNFGDVLARDFNKITFRKFWMPWPLWLPTRLMFGFNKPRITILGSEFAGRIEAVGTGVTRFKVGDAVFGYRGPKMGANAEYLCMREDGMLAIKPSNMSDVEAATVPYGAHTALSLLRKANIQRGQKVLINGASGSIGSYALQLAKHYGAEVTGVCSTPRVEQVKSLGADKVIDYTQEDFTQNGETYDLIFDVLGKSSFSRCKNSLKPNGRYFLVSFRMSQVFQMLWTKLRGGKRVICALSSEKPQDLVLIKELVETGQLKTVIDRCYPLEQTAEAHRYFEGGQKKGSVVITLGQ
ncbi:MAG: alcohol dehydrogenase [Chloroflexota bacterium]|nr:MAG: alcohol dehydrogenase [Chloroflexota bacterium]